MGKWIVLMVVLVSCDRPPKYEYPMYLVDINCGDLYSGKAYRMAMSGTSTWGIWYRTMEWDKLFIPVESCIVIRLEKLEDPGYAIEYKN